MWTDYYYQGGGAGSPDKTLRTIRKDQLKPPGHSPFNMPKEYRAGLKSLMEGLSRRDPGTLESLLATGRQGHAMDHRSLNSPDAGEHSVPLTGFLNSVRALPMPEAAKMFLTAPPLAADPSADLAARQFAFNQRLSSQSELKGRIQGGERILAAPRVFPSALLRAVNSPAPMRHLDWNPDVRVALKLGVDVRYASVSNEIYSPQLAISSSTVQARGVTAGGMGNFEGSSSGGSSGSGGHAGVSSGSVSSGGTTTVGTSTTAGGGSGGGHIK
jgi:hypothetical protein